ncbi:general transcription factor IIH subunit [Achlya hypogyna]|uniref:General transcription factor IIH subunit n=1 Tax=Achlya hypogyna TaxID=1202772 RepID=A0A1V9YHP7_ACHHY|nr:general transcription factor IIH subunit [Achlya hypogyna]
MAAQVLCSAEVRYREQHNDKSRNSEGSCDLVLTQALLYLRSAGKQRAIPLQDVQDLQVNAASAARVRYMMRMRLRQTPPVMYVFEFNSEDDLQLFKTQLGSRLVQSSTTTPSSKQEVMSETERKQRAALLAAHPNTLKRQHTDMVTGGLISESDFWNLTCRKQLLMAEAEKRQKTGKTSEILTDVQGQNQSGEQAVKYNLNPEIIHQIFVQYPVVYMAYQEQVPDKMDGVEFWTMFVKSKYAHRDRLKHQQSGVEDLFTIYEEKWQKQHKAPVVQGIVDPLIDLTATAADGLTAAASAGRPEVTDTNIAKFNRHAADVLNAAVTIHPKKSKAVHTKRAALAEAVVLDDLQPPTPAPYIPLSLDNTARYFEHDEHSLVHRSFLAQLEPAQRALERMLMQQPNLPAAFPKSAASDITAEILAECASDAATEAMANPRSEQHARFIPNDFKTLLTNLFHDVNELLRHYLSFKEKVAADGSPEARMKLERIKAKMGEKYEHVERIRQKLPPAERTSLGPLFLPLSDQLNIPFLDD